MGDHLRIRGVLIFIKNFFIIQKLKLKEKTIFTQKMVDGVKKKFIYKSQKGYYPFLEWEIQKK
jgi:hypothetical protein